MMRPKKDEEIYFAQSQGGGLIVDDKKNNIKYIIERDGRITKLFGSFDRDNLNLYDMRDARNISDRVRRLLGVDHKYTDFHYFLRGYHMSESVIKNCSDFLGESIWSDMQDRSSGKTIKKEEGRIIGELEDGTRLIMSNDAFADGNLVEFDEGNIYTLKESSDEELYIAVINEGNTDVYYMYDEDSEDIVNMVECFTATDSLRVYNDFGVLRALISQDEWDNGYLDGLKVEEYKHYTDFEFGSYEFLIYDDRDWAITNAIEMEEDLLDETTFTRSVVEQFRNALGDSFLDEDQMKEDLKESQESYYDDLSEEDAIDELLRWKIIEDTEDYFEVDEYGDVDHTLPKFDYGDYKDEYVEKYMDNINDYVDAYISTYGYDGIESYINKTTLAKKIIESDGPESMISTYDGLEREEKIDGTTYYIYRRN